MKEEAIWWSKFACFEEALAAIKAWPLYYNTERPHDSLGERSPAEARAKALTDHKTAA